MARKILVFNTEKSGNQQIKYILGFENGRFEFEDDFDIFLRKVRDYRWNKLVFDFTTEHFLEFRPSQLCQTVAFVRQQMPKQIGIIGIIDNSYQRKALHGSDILLLNRNSQDEAEIDSSEFNSGVTIQQIEHTVSKFWEIPVALIQSSDQSHDVVRPRQVCMYLARKFTILTLDNIGEQYGGDHARAIYSIKAVEKRMRKDTAFGQRVLLAEKEIARKYMIAIAS